MEIDSPEWANLIIDGAKFFNIDLDRDATRQFGIHARELIKWNQTINLTAITDPFEVGVKHFLDCISPAHLINPSAMLLDIGSGGGFPGIALKILMPSLRVTLIEGSRKKVNFLKHIIRTLKLEGIQARKIRAEELAKNVNFIGAFDVIISRALGDLEKFVKLASPLLAADGRMIALKGRVEQKEIKTLRPAGTAGRQASDSMQSGPNRYVIDVEKYKLPFTALQRSLITISIKSVASNIQSPASSIKITSRT
jgi:16S rRNA (guanine527-N7)-methyltransferase